MAKLSLDLADLKVTSFEAGALPLSMPDRLPESPTRAECTMPRFTCALPCPSQVLEG